MNIIREYQKNKNLWKEIKGFENYSINADGIIINTYTENIIKYNTVSKTIAPSVKLYKNKRGYVLKVAKLVFEAFKRPIAADEILLSKDNNKMNCKLSNIIVLRPIKQESHQRRYKAVYRIDFLEEKVKLYKSIEEAARENYCSASSIQRVLKGECAAAIGYTWRYKEELIKDNYLLDQLGGLDHVMRE